MTNQTIDQIWDQLPADGSMGVCAYNRDFTAVAGVWRGPQAQAIGGIVEHLAHISPAGLAAIRAVVLEHVED